LKFDFHEFGDGPRLGDHAAADVGFWPLAANQEVNADRLLLPQHNLLFIIFSSARLRVHASRVLCPVFELA
jgi:hypothetical protein